jgi:Ca-activated chloride channel family protein
MRFLNPSVAWWILGALVVALVIRWRLKSRLGAATTAPWVFNRAYRASPLRKLPVFVLIIVLLLIGVALLDPVLPYSETQIQSNGLDIVVVLDLSSSMQEQMERTAPPRTMQNLSFNGNGPPVARPRPVSKTRLDATKDAIKALIRRRFDDRVGLVVFSDHAYVVSPLTFDHDYLLRYVDLIDDQILRGEGMTAIGDGLALADYLLARQSSTKSGQKNKVVVLFTDGENNAGRDPLDVLEEADAANIRVHMVGVALEQEIRQKPQVQKLLQTVRRNGGRYFNAETGQELDAASRAIDAIEKGVLISRSFQHDAPVYDWFALPALIGLVGVFLLRALPVFVDQT